MVNYAFFALFCGSTVYAACTGQMNQVNAALLQSFQTSVELALSLAGVLLFWTGVMRTAEAAGLVRFLAEASEPLLRVLFPDVPKGHPAFGFIASNLSANFFGLGNAATPMGILAMNELKKLSPQPEQATRSMITFLVMNTAAVTLVPTSVLAIGVKHGAANPADVIAPTLLATVLASFAALLIDRLIASSKRQL